MNTAEKQPAKFAAFESQWETEESAPICLIQIPDPENEGNKLELLPVPGALSFLAYNSFDAKVTGLKDIPADERPPVALVFYTFRIMVGLGFLFFGLMILVFFIRKNLEKHKWFLKLMMWLIPLPVIALELGWTVTEVGRQPWIVYGLMRTSDAVSPIATSQVATTLIGFFLIYLLLGIADVYLLIKYARKGPKPLTTDTK
jgi:cytochrome d ubiquinol oxidase subunit I